MSIDSINTLEQIIADNGYRLTTARKKIFKLLESQEPQLMQDLIKRASGEVDRVSVYRTIELFEKLGIVNRLYIGWKYKLELSDDFVAHHHHMSCLSCDTTIGIKDEKHINEFIEKVAKEEGFKPRNHVFEIDGYCSNCRS